MKFIVISGLIAAVVLTGCGAQQKHTMVDVPPNAKQQLALKHADPYFGTMSGREIDQAALAWCDAYRQGIHTTQMVYDPNVLSIPARWGDIIALGEYATKVACPEYQSRLQDEE